MGLNDVGVAPDSWLLTSKGPRQAGELVGKPSVIEQLGDSSGLWVNALESVKVVLADGRHLTASLTTEIKTVDGWCALQDLSLDTTIPLVRYLDYHWSGEGSTPEGYILGHLIGDGSFDTSNYPLLCVWDDPATTRHGKYIIDVLRQLPQNDDWQGWRKSGEYWKVTSPAMSKMVKYYGPRKGQKTITPFMERCNSDLAAGTLAGCIDTDGSPQGTLGKTISVRLSSVDYGMLLAAQRMAQRLGINGRIHQRSQAGKKMMPNRQGGQSEYNAKALYELIIPRSSLEVFMDRVPMQDQRKIDRLRELYDSFDNVPKPDPWESKVVSVTPVGREPVCNFVSESSGEFDVNGVYVRRV